MKQLLVFLVSLVFGIGMSAQNMPYILKYKVDKNKLNSNYYIEQEGDTIMYHNISNIDYLHINSKEHSLRFKNFEREEIPVSAIDTVFVYRDKFLSLENPNNWTEIIFSTEQVYFYKENTLTGHPEALLMVAQNDTIPQGQYSYVSFDDNGHPKYMNVNGQHFFIEKICDSYYEALVINSDSSFFYADRIPLQLNPVEASNRVIMRSGYTQSNAQNAVSLLNHFIGGVTMVGGGIAILSGCSMLVPGANIAVGATIAISGAATFLAGALTTVRATDQLISDGSHTEGFDAASNLFGMVGIIGGEGSIARKVFNIALNDGIAGAQVVLDANTDMREAYARAMKIVEGRLTTGDAKLYNIQSNAVMLYGNITRKMNIHDKVGIMISEDKNALTVKNCMYSENNETGEFCVLFDELTPTQEYFYRAYYYATEFDTGQYNPYFVSGVRSFVMPGVKTVGYEENGNHNYTINGKVAWLKTDNTHYLGVCYSQTNETPTIVDEYKEITHDGEGDFSISLSLNEGGYYYRTYAKINGEIVYGEVMYLTDEKSMLIKLYNDTNGSSWTDNTNWCTEEPLNNWYGINPTWSNHVREIDLRNNNLSGNINIKGMRYLEDMLVTGNNISSITIDDCPSLDLGYGFRGLDGISLDNLSINNCFNSFGQHFLGEYDVTTTIKNIVFSNMRNLGRVFFDYVISDEILFKNCHFDSQGIGIEYNSNVNTLTIDNCIIPSGRAGGSGLNHLVIRNSRLGDWWVIEAKSTITISNTIIEGHVVNVSGTPNEVYKYMWNLLRGY